MAEHEIKGLLNKDKLIEEIKILRSVNSSLHKKIVSLEALLFKKDVNYNILEKKVQKEHEKCNFIEAEKNALLRKQLNKIRTLEREIRKKDIFNKKIIGTSKNMKEALMISEMDSLRAVNNTLISFISIISLKIGFDVELVCKLAEVADNIEDNILKLFISRLKDNSKHEEIITKDIKTADQDK